MNIDNKNSATVSVKNYKNPRSLYEHQIDAQVKLNEINKKDNFSTLLVLPTGAGKTFTSVHWLLKNAIDKDKKVLWIAHRHLLLEQARESFQSSASSDVMVNRSSFKYRVISGKHDKLVNVKNNEDVLISSKDSLVRNLKSLDNWIDEEVYLVIDEAHHATAKTYRKIIDYLQSKVKSLKIIGLTATPFRTFENEKGLLGKIFYDDIVYKIDLKTLINKSLLSTPIFEECDTELLLGENIGLNALKSIERLDNIPTDIAESIASNGKRNKIIVNRYLEKKDDYGKTIVFALNRLHAITLKKLFEVNGVDSEFIISGTSSEFTGIDLTNSDIERNVEKYRNDEIDVLINVNILTEGVDLPDTKTIFLTRPTISKTLMTQMIGRGLRGERAGGTKEAYIVSFIDDWNDSIAWVNPETIIEEESVEFKDNELSQKSRDIRYISIKKIEEFAKLLDESIDTRDLEEVEYIERVPIGMYNFSYLENEVDINCQILIYNTSKPYYDKLIEDLEDIFIHFKIDDEYIEEDLLVNMVRHIEKTYFDRYIIPSYNKKDIEDLIKYYAQKSIEPSFYELSYIDRKKLDLSVIAKHIDDEDMGPRKQTEYLNSLWEDDDNLLKIYYDKYTYFLNQVRTEIDKLTGMFEEYVKEENVIYEQRNIKELSLSDIGKYYPDEEIRIRDLVFGKNKNEDDNYRCLTCDKESSHRGDFHIDHIKPLNKGGLTEEENLQILCKSCNLKKSDHYEH